MFKRISFVLVLVVVVLLASCDQKQQLQKLAESTLQQTIEDPGHLKVIGISEPDSAFGTAYFTQHEVNGMIILMNQVSDSIMRRTNNMTEFHPDDLYVIGMAERQMKATSEIRSLIYNAGKKGNWSGWKVKIDYQSRDRNGIDYRAERWFFIDKEGNHVIKTFEIPIP